MQVQLTVNGKSTRLDLAPNTLLVQALRENLHLTGTHVGCDTAQCGACTVIMNGRAIKSCNVLAAQVSGAEITTIEGLAKPDGTMHPMQAAFKECHGLQCGFCTTGMVMSSVDLCTHHPKATEGEIRELLEGNLCRCTGYQNIVKADRLFGSLATGQAALPRAGDPGLRQPAHHRLAVVQYGLAGQVNLAKAMLGGSGQGLQHGRSLKRVARALLANGLWAVFHFENLTGRRPST